MKTEIVACQIELTNICPIGKCAECARPYMTRSIGSMHLSLAKDIIKECSEHWGNISFNFNGLGEPLIYSELPNLIRYIGEISPSSRIEIFTSFVCSDNHAENIISAIKEVPNNFLMAGSLHLYNHKGKRIKLIQSGFKFKKFFNSFENTERVDFHIAMNKTIYHPETVLYLFRETFEGYLPSDRVHIVEKLDPWFDLVRDKAVECNDVLNSSVCDYPFKVLHVTYNGDILICCIDDVFGKIIIDHYWGYDKPCLLDVWEKGSLVYLRDRHKSLNVEGISPCNKCGRTKGYLKR